MILTNPNGNIHYLKELRSDVKAMAGNMESALLGHHKELSVVAANSQSRDQVRGREDIRGSIHMAKKPLKKPFENPPETKF